jgi:hypothetical protein
LAACDPVATLLGVLGLRRSFDRFAAAFADFFAFRHG